MKKIWERKQCLPAYHCTPKGDPSGRGHLVNRMLLEEFGPEVLCEYCPVRGASKKVRTSSEIIAAVENGEIQIVNVCEVCDAACEQTHQHMLENNGQRPDPEILCPTCIALPHVEEDHQDAEKRLRQARQQLRKEPKQ